MPRFVVIGQKATAADDFLLDDLPGTSGRLDVLLRCLRAALLFSHGLRRDVIVYLVLCGGPLAPRVMRVDGGAARFIRPDERNLANLAKKLFARRTDGPRGFREMRDGIAIASGGLEEVFEDLGATTPYVLEEGAPDLRDAVDVGRADAAFFVGDHLGFDPSTRARLARLGARPVGVGPISVHADDAITIVTNEIDRRRVPIG